MVVSKKKVVFVTVFHPQISKNILNTDAFLSMRDSGKYLIVLLVPDAKKEFFLKHYSYENVVIEGFDMQTFIEEYTENLMQVISRLLINTHYLHYRRREILDANRSLLGRIRHISREIFVKLFAGNRTAIKCYRKVDSLFSQNNVFSGLFQKYSPSLVFTTDIFEQMGTQLLRESKRRGIKTVGMVRSWDNCLSKGLLRVAPDESIVNNGVIKNELLEIHGVPPDRVTAVGLPQFDSFINKAPATRDEFFAKIGIDPSDKLILFAPAGTILSDTDKDIVDILVKAKNEGDMPKNIHLFVRNHPQHPSDLSSFKDTPGVTVQIPGQKLYSSTYKETELTPDDLDFLRNILAHTDLLIWVATSLCLDALVYDIPQIVVNFDGYQKKDYYNSVRRYHDEDHMKKMFTLKPFKIAHTQSDLVAQINLYLNDKKIDASERELVRQQQLFRSDGRAGKRIAEVLERALS